MAAEWLTAGRAVAVMLVGLTDRTQLATRHGDAAALRLVTDCLGLIDARVGAGDGRVLKYVGDGVLAVFPSVEKAVQTAASLQDEMTRAESLLARQGAQLRIGICTGHLTIDGTDVFPDTVTLATRLAGRASGEEIFLSGDARIVLPLGADARARVIEPESPRGGPASAIFEYVWRDDSMTVRALKQAYGDVLTVEVSRGADRFVLGAGRERLTVGRADDNDLVVDDKNVSRHHAEIARRGDKFVLVDRSTNGTFVYPESGEHFLLRREELTLAGAGRFCLGSDAAEPIHYRVKGPI
jgi:class 3 adenylate cyclase